MIHLVRCFEYSHHRQPGCGAHMLSLKKALLCYVVSWTCPCRIIVLSILIHGIRPVHNPVFLVADIVPSSLMSYSLPLPLSPLLMR